MEEVLYIKRLIGQFNGLSRLFFVSLILTYLTKSVL